MSQPLGTLSGMEWIGGNDGARVNGFPYVPTGRQLGLHQVLPLSGAAAGLGVPVLGVVYGIVRVGYEEYYRGLGLTPEIVGLGQAAIVSRVAVVMGTLAALIGTWIMFGVVLYRLVAPVRSGRADADRSRRDWFRLVFAYGAALVVLFVPFLIATWVAGGRGLSLWASGAVPAGVLALQLSWTLADTDLRLGDRVRRATRSAYEGAAPRIGVLVVLTIVGACIVALVLNFWNDTEAAGRAVRRTGRLPTSHLNVTVSPARVVPKGIDLAGVCNGSRNAVLVGRNDDTSFVLLLPSKDTDPPSEVVPLADSEYAVVTATVEPQPCNPQVP